jgi:indole-3-glycerol phosphate synthase
VAAEAEAVASLRPRVALLRKDFIVSENQLREALYYGADSVLLIGEWKVVKWI